MSIDTQSRSISEPTKELTEQTSRPAQKEIDLAKAELTAKGRQIGIGAGTFGGAGVVAVLALGTLVATVILLLAITMTAWLAALIVTAVLAAIAGALALLGKTKVRRASPPTPEQTIETVKEDVQEAKTGAQEGRA